MPNAQNSPIALIGYRGIGKTTIAELLAAKLDYAWIDADDEVEQRAGKSIAAIFSDLGEDAFRDLEVAVVDDLCRRERTVLALGGGAVLRKENQKCLEKCQAVIWLQASAEVIAKRISGDPTTAKRRPNLTNRGGRQEIEQMLATREPIYRACATLEVDTEGKDPAEITEEIFGRLAAND